jgi:hypothetical protein
MVLIEENRKVKGRFQVLQTLESPYDASDLESRSLSKSPLCSDFELPQKQFNESTNKPTTGIGSER